MEQPPGDVNEQFIFPSRKIKEPAAIKLIVGAAHKLVQIANRAGRQLVGVRQGQIGTGCAVK